MLLNLNFLFELKFVYSSLSLYLNENIREIDEFIIFKHECNELHGDKIICIHFTLNELYEEESNKLLFIIEIFKKQYDPKDLGAYDYNGIVWYSFIIKEMVLDYNDVKQISIKSEDESTEYKIPDSYKMINDDSLCWNAKFIKLDFDENEIIIRYKKDKDLHNEPVVLKIYGHLREEMFNFSVYVNSVCGDNISFNFSKCLKNELKNVTFSVFLFTTSDIYGRCLGSYKFINKGKIKEIK